uniref:Uncharacterized protein n=1 Tax=Arundo donax TaxID=35708 RepID=A0A0A9BEB0_ARUDO
MGNHPDSNPNPTRSARHGSGRPQGLSAKQRGAF